MEFIPLGDILAAMFENGFRFRVLFSIRKLELGIVVVQLKIFTQCNSGLKALYSINHFERSHLPKISILKGFKFQSFQLP